MTNHPRYTNLAPNHKAEKLIVFLHGYGSNGNNLITLAQHYAKTIKNAVFIAPHAPFPFEMDSEGYQWFSLNIQNEHDIVKGSQSALPYLEQLIDKELEELSLSHSDLIIIGFSQGCTMAVEYGVSRNHPLQALILLSGRVLTINHLKIESKQHNICLIHGQNDLVVPYDCSLTAQELLKPISNQIETHIIPNLEHSINEGVVEKSLDFLAKT